MDQTQSFIDARASYLDSASEGSKFIASTEAQGQKQAREAQDKEAEKVWQAQPVKLPYRYRDAYASGETDLTKDLPNKFLEPGTVDVAGHDLATGKEVYKLPSYIDMRGMPKEGIEALVRSRQTPGKPAPSEDIAAIAKIALPCVQAGCNFEEFSKLIPPSWNDAQRNTAWNAAKDAHRMQLLERDIEDRYSSVLLRPAPEIAPTVEQLSMDKGFASAAKVIYQGFESKMFSGSDKEASEWLVSHLRWFDTNSAQQARVVTRLKNASEPLMKAYELAFKQWDQTAVDWSFGNALANAGRSIVDPANLLGLGAGKILVSTAGRLAAGRLITSMLAKGATKMQIAGALAKEGAKAVAPRAAVGAATGGIAGAAHTVAQGQASGQPASAGDIALSAGVGAVGGAAFTTLIPEGATLAAQYGSQAGKAFAARVKAADWSSPPAGSPAAMRGSVGFQRPPEPDVSYDFETGFFNPMVRALEESPKAKFTAEEARNTFRSNKHFSEQVWQASGVDEVLANIPDGATLSKAELLAELSNRPVGLEMRKLGAGYQYTPHELLSSFDRTFPAQFRSAQAEAIELEALSKKVSLTPKEADREDFLKSRLGRIDLSKTLMSYQFDVGAGNPDFDAAVRPKLIGSRSTADLNSLYRDPVPAGLMRADSATLKGKPGTANEDVPIGMLPEANYRGFALYDPYGSGASRSHHFGGVSDVSAYARTTDRAFDPSKNTFGDIPSPAAKDGDTMLFIENVQGDIAQARASIISSYVRRGASVEDAELDMYGKSYTRWSSSASTKSRPAGSDFSTATDKEKKAFFTDQAFWAQLRNQHFTAPPQILEKYHKENMTMSLLFQAAVEGKGYLGWVGPEAMRKMWGGEGWKSSRLDVRADPTSRDLWVVMPAESSRKFELPVTISLDAFLSGVKSGLFGGNYADLAARISKYKHDLQVNPSTSLAPIDLGKEVVLLKPSFGEYADLARTVEKRVKRIDTHASVKKTEIEHGSARERTSIYYIEITPELRTRLIKGGVPLSKLAPVAVGTAALAGGQTKDAEAKK